MSDIFISYAREDERRVKLIVKHLESFGWSVFWDRHIPGGKLWPAYLADRIDKSRCMLVIWSRYSVSSEFVLEEASRGKDRNILVPVRIDSVQPPFGFGLRQVIDLQAWGNDAAHPQFRKIIDTLNLMLPSPFPTTSNPIGEQQILLSSTEEIIALLQNPSTIVEALDRASEEIPFRGSDRVLFEMKRVKYTAGMSDYEKLNWIQEMQVLLSPYVSGRET